MDLEKLVVKIEADLSDLKKGLDKANSQVKKSSGGMSKSFDSLGKSLDNIGRRVIKFGGLLGVAFGGFQVAKVVSVGREIEDLQVRLKALFGSVDEGAKAFDVMVKFASRVPFTLQDIQQASGNLAVVSKDATELAEVLEITGNVAGATGLDFRQTAEQIQRSFAGGIASADVFRERGVRSMLGFQAGAEVSASETIRAFKEKFGKGGEFGGVTSDLANTLTGTLSMLDDKLFQFRKAISDEFTVVVKENFKELNQAFEENSRAIEDLGKKIGQNLAGALQSFAENIDAIIVGLKALGVFLTTAVGISILKFIAGLTKLQAIIIGLGGAYTILSNALEKVIESDKKAQESYDRSAKALDLNSKELQENFKRMSEFLMIQQSVPQAVVNTAESFNILIATESQVKDITEKVGIAFDNAGEDISKALGRSVIMGENFGDAMKNIFRSVASEIVSTIVQILIVERVIKRLKTSLEGLTGGGDITLGGVAKSIGTSILGNTLTSFLGFKNGGFVAPNKPVIVGERGAELLVPRTASNVVSNSDLGGGTVVNQNLNFSTGIVPTVRAEVMNMLPLIKQETLQAVAETRSRGGTFARTFGA